jgi:hypothetical protein
MAVFILRRILNEDLANMIIEFNMPTAEQVERRRLQVVYQIFNYEKNSDRETLTAFEVCQIHKCGEGQKYFPHQGWVRLANQLLQLQYLSRKSEINQINGIRDYANFRSYRKFFDTLINSNFPPFVLGEIDCLTWLNERRRFGLTF